MGTGTKFQSCLVKSKSTRLAENVCSAAVELWFTRDARSDSCDFYTGLALTASTESKALLLKPPPAGTRGSVFTTYVSSLSALQDALQKELDSYTNSPPPPAAPTAGGECPTTTDADLLQARIVIALISSLKGDWQSVLNVVPGEDEVGEGYTPSPGKSDYMDTMRIKALVLKGQALSHTTPDNSLSLQVHRAATRLLASFPNQKANPSLTAWAEKALGYYALATYHVWSEMHVSPSSPSSVASPSTPDGNEEAQGSDEGEGPVGVAIGQTIVDESTLANAFRNFHKFIAAPAGSRPAQGAEANRREVYRGYFKFISLLLLPQSHPSRPINPTTGTSRSTNLLKVGTKEELQEELKAISKVYETYLLSSLQFPKADEYHEVVGEWADQVVENWRVSGGSVEDAAPVVETLYRASKKTFHSPRILRHLFYTLTATGNFQDAIAALNTYLDLVQKAMDRISKGNEEKDFDTQRIIIQTAVEGIRVLCKFGVGGQKPMDIAAKLEKWVEEWRIREKDILAEVYRGIGMANAAFARQTPEGELRPAAQQAAADAFKKGLTYDPIDMQGWYGLALVESEMRSIDDATESARKGLGALKYHFVDNEDPDDVEGNARDYKRFAVPLLHLLALLMTARDDFENSEKVCKNAFDIVGEGREAVADLGVMDKVAIFELMMTQLAIVEAVEDSGTATSMAEQLLALYGMLFDGTHLVQRQHGDSQDNDGDVSPRPTTTMSRRSRLFGRNKKQFSSSHTSLPRQAQDPNSPPSQGGTIKRPKSGHKSLVGTSSVAPTITPKIQIIDAQGTSASPSEKSHRKLMRPSSVSGGTIRRMRSLSSLGRKHDPRTDDPPTPPLPSSTEASSLNFDTPSGSVNGKDPHLFHTLKNKLQNHHLIHSSVAGSVTSIPETVQADGAVESRREPIKVDAIPHNLPHQKLPYPLGALGRTISDDGQGHRTIRRPIQLPEPKLAVDEEQKQVLAVLRKAWICVAGLYRRAGCFGDALMATDEASSLVGKEGDGEADVLTERGFLASAQGRKALAAELFEQAIALDVDHPQAIIGISKLLLNVKDMDLEPDFVDSSASARPCSRGTDSSSGEGNEEANLNKLASRNRALGLLEKLVVSPRGWDLPDAWFLLADALEKAGEIERAKCALWRVVELEDGTGIRGWRVCGVGVV
ncbi:hypothetical protein FN846DRAFT_1000212 [Sphaerosporella brunnea]|uniref:Filamentation protein n=1 Tax=Sphaerosporella brunnea TaxID=1250544 RepID=A0A5J5EGS6_9PEZI|nr:hypothetical protein FN846DRAFT_1000212 [Sphaerosporella brunnea]